MPAAKPHLCACGASDPLLFYANVKGRCKRCSSKHVLQRLETNPAAKRLNQQRSAQWQRDNPVRFRWLQAKNRAKRKELEFDITEDTMRALYDQQNGMCAYSGLRMTWDCSTFNRQSVSVDRIDSEQGYVMGNVVLCCAVVNTMKSDMAVNEFISFIGALYEHNLTTCKL